MITRRALGALMVLATVLASPIAMREADGAPRPNPASIDLVAQTPLATPGSEFVVQLRLPGVPNDGSITLSIHQRVRSRSELDASITGDGLRGRMVTTVTPLATLPEAADGTRRFTISLNPATGGVPLTASGVYPLEISAKDAAGTEVTTLVTHMIVPPEDDATPLRVAVVAHLGAPPSLNPDGTTAAVDTRDLDAASGLVAALRSVDNTVVSLAVTPQTIENLAAMGEPAANLLTGLKDAAAGRPVLQQPYVNISLDALVAADLPYELLRQIERGDAVLTDTFGKPPTKTTWLAGPDLGADGLSALPGLGARHAVVNAAQVAPLPDGLANLSAAQPFLLAPPESDESVKVVPSIVDAMALDPVVIDRLEGPGSPALVANRVLTELAVLWFEQPGVERGAVLPLNATISPDAVRAILTGLDAGGVFSAVSLDDLFDTVAPLQDARRKPLARSLTPTSLNRIAPAEASEIRADRSIVRTFGDLVGVTSPLANSSDRQFLLATSADLTRLARQEAAANVIKIIDDIEAGITGPERFVLTLTDRKGTIPLTLRNDSGIPLNVVVQLRSPKLSFPEGTAIPITLEEGSTRIDIPVEARVSGAFPLNIEVTSPDGQRQLVVSRYTIRSTAVAGAGIVLSIGAGLFLIIWWAQHWRRTRRSGRLIAAPQPPSQPANPSTTAGQ